jgi:hypothetical protein
VEAKYVWTEPFTAAVLETDNARMPERLKTAKAAIDARLRELQSDHGGTPDERQAIGRALAALTVLRTERAGSPALVVCRICGKPTPLEDCKLDEKGQAVHGSCIVEEVLRNAAKRSDGGLASE